MSAAQGEGPAREFWVVPAIDLMGGRVVRLAGGDFSRVRAYSDDPVAQACALVQEGATRLHVVDLDGAREGRPVHLSVLARLVQAAGVPVQFGGGLRSLDSLEQALQAGASCVLVGTRALEGDLMARALERFGPERVWAAVDVRDGYVAVAGWQQLQPVRPQEAAVRLAGLGVRRALVTDAGRDGLLAGPNVALALEVASCGLEVLLAGGVASAQDVRAVATVALRQSPEGGRGRLRGLVVGRALYEGRLTLAEAMAAALAAAQEAAGGEVGA